MPEVATSAITGSIVGLSKNVQILRAPFSVGVVDGRAGLALGFASSRHGIRIAPDGKVLSNDLDAKELAALRAFAKDHEAKAGSEIAYDACGAAQMAEAAAAASAVVACGTPEPFLPWACGAALMALVAAEAARRDACAPKNCYSNFDCTDRYGSGYVCNGGACVKSVISFPSSGQCFGNWDCSWAWGEVCGIDGYCRFWGGGGSGGSSGNGGTCDELQCSYTGGTCNLGHCNGSGGGYW